MDYQIPKAQLNNYLKLPKTFDWDWVDQEPGFDKVFKFVPQEVYAQLKASADTELQEIFRLLTKAAVHYAFILDIPRIKVQISNYGIDQPSQEKTRAAPWWDVRDLGLRYLKTADQSLSKALSHIAGLPEIKEEVPLFDQSNGFIATPEQFERIYSINESPEVYLMLVPLLQRAMQTFINSKLKPCAIADLQENEALKELITSALAFYALHYAAKLPTFTFLNNSVVIQYEELPWQKSMVISETARERVGHNFLNLAEENVSQIIAYIKDNATDFPCYTPTEPAVLDPVKKRSGLYLL
jgi:hypothetical protein